MCINYAQETSHADKVWDYIREKPHYVSTVSTLQNPNLYPLHQHTNQEINSHRMTSLGAVQVQNLNLL